MGKDEEFKDPPVWQVEVMIVRMIKDVGEDSPVLYRRWKTEILWKGGERFLTAEEGKREKIFIVRLVIEGDGLEECFWLVLKKIF